MIYWTFIHFILKILVDFDHRIDLSETQISVNIKWVDVTTSQSKLSSERSIKEQALLTLEETRHWKYNRERAKNGNIPNCIC